VLFFVRKIFLISMIAINAPNTVKLLMGNEAIARGALEAGVGVATAYPGNPSSEIIGTLAQVAKELRIYVEWSINEKVAMEVAAGASLANLRALCAMKQNGLNVALDFLSNLNLTGIKKGFVLIVCDDPGGISSTNEQDSRYVAKALNLPLLEPATSQEAKEMVQWAFELSEEISNVCIMRSVTRISHARGKVTLGELPNIERHVHFDLSIKPYASIGGKAPELHQTLHQKLARIMEIYESSPFNWYTGPKNPELLIITCGSGWFYSLEAVRILSAEKSVGILKLGTTWPLPRKLIEKHMLQTGKILVVEEVDAFLEGNLKELAVDMKQGHTWTFYGKASGHIPSFGEVNPDIVINGIANALHLKYVPRDPEYHLKTQEIVQKYIPSRESQFCAGCPHRATFWAIKNALTLDGREDVLTGDIGCYAMAVGSTGFCQIRTVHAMGSGAGIASGMGMLNQFGFNQPVLTVCGDSTFFHASIPALINGVHSKSQFILILLDNGGTAMTGFQPHPGINLNAMGEPAPIIDMESLCHALGVKVMVTDPYDLNGTTEKLLEMLHNEGKPSVLISRRECILIRAKREKPAYKMHVDPDQCIGEACGCDRFCTRVFKCPGLIWDKNTKKAKIDEAICSGCGVCVEICPKDAILRELNG
jgi:indolepyruvate ferredoxin oxidoreductase alpha subunit